MKPYHTKSEEELKGKRVVAYAIIAASCFSIALMAAFCLWVAS